MYNDLRTAAKTGNTPSSIDLIMKAKDLEISPLNLMIGIIQPILYDIGDLWAKKEYSIALEHQFSTFVQNLLSAIYFNYQELNAFRQSVEPTILLVNANEN